MTADNSTHHQTYTIVPGPKMGVVTPELLEAIVAVVMKHRIPLLKLTNAQRLALIGHAPEEIEQIWQELGQSGVPQKPVGICYIKACPGKPWCKYGVRDSLALGAKVEKAMLGLPLPAKTKVGISGCSMNCCEGFVRDLGIFGKREGWTLVFGGNGAGRPRIGDVIGEGLSDEELLALAEKALHYYSENARKRERTARFMDRTPLAEFKRAVAGA